MQLVLLCGGKGTRLSALNLKQPKSMISINGHPFLSYILHSFKKYNISRVHFCLGYKYQYFLDYFNAFNLGIEYSYTIDPVGFPLGTGGALINSLKFLEENFILQYGDTLLNINYAEMFALHATNSADLTMAIIRSRLSNETPNVFCSDLKSLVKTDFVYDKQNATEEFNYIDYGAMVFRKSALEQYSLKKLDLSIIQQEFIFKQRVIAYEATIPYIEIGTVNSLRRAEAALRNVLS